jgi:HEAT repeat protein
VQALIGQLKDAKNLVRASALSTLGTLKLDPVILIPICTRMLADPNNGVRRRAAVNLGDIGKAAAEAIPALQKAATDENEAARLAAVDALAKINREPGVSSRKSLSQLLKDLGSKNGQTQFEARSALRRMGQDVVPELIRTLEDPSGDPNARGDAAQGLAYAGKNGGPEVKVLLDVLKDKQNYVRANALSSLGVLHIEAKTLVPICIEMLGDKNNGVRRRAAMNLGGYGSAAAEAVPALKNAASDSDQPAREAATWALSQIERSEGAKP